MDNIFTTLPAPVVRGYKGIIRVSWLYETHLPPECWSGYVTDGSKFLKHYSKVLTKFPNQRENNCNCTRCGWVFVV